MKEYRSLIIFAFMVPLLSGCTVADRMQRSADAQSAKEQMVGMSKEEILSCMGIPQAKEKQGKTEVWDYTSGGETDTFGGGYGTSTARATAAGTITPAPFGNSATYNGTATGSGNSTFVAGSTTQARYCRVNIVFAADKVSAINYSGHTGGLITQGEQCAYAVQNCFHRPTQ